MKIFFLSLFYKELRTPRRSDIEALLEDKAFPFIHYYSATLSESCVRWGTGKTKVSEERILGFKRETDSLKRQTDVLTQ